MARFRFQYSLASLLFVVTIVCLLLSLYSTSNKLQSARQRLHANRYESAFFQESELDFNKLHSAVMLASCRVFVPEGREFWLHIQSGQIPESGGHDFGGGNLVGPGYKGCCEGFSLSPGLHAFYVESNNFEGDDGKPSFSIRGSGLGETWFTGWGNTLDGLDSTRLSHPSLGEWKLTVSLKGKKSSWLAVKNRHRAGRDLQYFTAKPGEPLELFRIMLMETVEEKQPDGTIAKYHRTSKGLANGIMIWIYDSQDKPPKTAPPAATDPDAGSNGGSEGGQ